MKRSLLILSTVAGVVVLALAIAAGDRSGASARGFDRAKPNPTRSGLKPFN